MKKRNVLIILFILIFLFLALLATSSLLLRFPAVQTFVAKKTVNFLERKFNTEVEIESVDFELFNRFTINGLYVEDQQSDTLAYIKKVEAQASIFSFLSRTINISSLNLTSPHIELKRLNDQGVMNFDFLLPPKKVDSLTDTTIINDQIWQLGLDNSTIIDLSLDYDDLASKMAVYTKLPELKMEFNEFDLNKKRIHFKNAFFKDLVVNSLIKDYGPDGPPPIDSSRFKMGHILKGGFEIYYDQVLFTNGYFTHDDYNKAPISGAMDYTHLDVKEIVIDVSDGKIIADTIFGHVNEISGKEKSGFVLSGLEADARVSKVGLTCENFTLRTPHSKLGNMLSMEYSIYRDWLNFPKLVYMNSNWEDAYLSFKDLRYFSQNLDKIEHFNLDIDGNIRGTVDNIRGRDLVLTLNDQTKFSGKASFRGLPDIDETFISINVDQFVSSAANIKELYPDANYPKDIEKLGPFQFGGRFDGFPYDFVTNGELLSSIGRIDADINFKIDRQNLAKYSGRLKTTDFEVGKWFENEDVFGSLSFNASINGEGLALEELNTRIEGEIGQFSINGYEYKNIDIDGRFDKNNFDGKLLVNEENIALTFLGDVTLDPERPVFNFKSEIENVNLMALNITDRPIAFRGQINTNFSGKSLDDLLGNFTFSKLLVQAGESVYNLDSIRIGATKINDLEKELRVRTSFLEAEIRGQYQFSELTVSLENFLNKYFRTVDTFQLAATEDQIFDFDIRIYNPKEITQLLHPDFKYIRNTKLFGNYHSKNQELQMFAQIPELVFNNITFKRFNLLANSTNDEFNAESDLHSVYFKDSTILTQTKLNTSIKGGKVKFDFYTQDNIAFNQFDINGKLQNINKTFTVTLDPSRVILNKQEWNFSENNLIEFSKKKLNIENLILSSKNKSFNLSTAEDVNNSTKLDLILNEIYLEDFNHFLSLTDFTLAGLANGNVEIRNIMDDPTLSANVFVKDMELNNEVLGDLTLKSGLSENREMITLNGVLKGKNHDMDLTGLYPLSIRKGNFNFDLNISKMNMATYQRLIKDYVTDIEGNMNGRVSLSGNWDKMDLSGALTITNGSTTVNYLNTNYSMVNQTVKLTGNTIDLNGLNLLDVDGNTATTSGAIYHDNLKDWNIDASVNSDNFQFLSTSKVDNELFYGNAYAKGFASFKGPFNDIKIYVKAEARENTEISIPIEDESETGEYTFFKFVNKQKDTANLITENVRLVGLEVELDLDLNSLAQINLILDENTGDIVKARGSGNIQIQLSKYGDFNTFGLYEIERGDYIFTLQNLVKKRFTLNEGSSIRFNGDIYEAKLDLRAIYNINASVYDLIQDYLIDASDDIQDKAKDRVPVDLNLVIQGVLQNPSIDFDIRLREVDPELRNAVDNTMQLVQANQNELNKQVFGLLVLNRFIPSLENTGVATVNVGNSAQNTVSEFLSTQLSLYLSDWLSTFVTDLSFDINYKTYDVNSIVDLETNSPITRNELQVALSKKFFDNRVSVNVGGNFDFGGTNTTQVDNRTTGLAGDFKVEYSITKDGRIKLKAFSRNEYDVFIQDDRNRAGIGISYSDEFNNLKDLADRRRKKKQKKQADKALREEQMEIGINIDDSKPN